MIHHHPHISLKILQFSQQSELIGVDMAESLEHSIMKESPLTSLDMVEKMKSNRQK